MTQTFDTALVSSDLSLDRVLNTGLPVALLFYEKELPPELRQTLDDLARRFAGKALMIMLARGDAPKALSRFGVRSFPSFVTIRSGKTVASQEDIRREDLQPFVAHLLGEGPAPAPRTPIGPEVAQPTAASHPISVSEADFDREVLRADLPVLVDFWAPWCGPCRMVAPALDAIARDQGQSLKIAKVNVDENPGLAARYGAMSIPTMLVVKGGREVDRWVGALPENAIRSRVSRWIEPGV